MNLVFLFSRLKNRIKDVLARRRAASDQPHTLAYHSMLQSIAVLSLQEKESLWFELRKQLAESGESVAYAERIFDQFSTIFCDQGGVLKDAAVLELGPGLNLAPGVLFALSGARYTAVDALAAFPDRPVEFYRNLLDELRSRPRIVGRTSINDSDFSEILTLNESVHWNPQRVAYVTPAPAENLPFPENHFDFIYSNASFEHFEEPDQVIRSIFRVLKPGGLTAHVIDLRDHADFKRPLDFLKVSHYKYSSPYGTNRWRAPDFEKSFRDAGFRVVKLNACDRCSITDLDYDSFDVRFQSDYGRSDLEILGIELIASKPA